MLLVLLFQIILRNNLNISLPSNQEHCVCIKPHDIEWDFTPLCMLKPFNETHG